MDGSDTSQVNARQEPGSRKKPKNSPVLAQPLRAPEPTIASGALASPCGNTVTGNQPVVLAEN